MRNINRTLSTFIEVSHLEYQVYDFSQQKIIWSSGLGQEVLGYSEQEFFKLSHNFYEALIHPDDLPNIKWMMDKIINSSDGEIIESTSRYKKSDGSYIWVYDRKTIFERGAKGIPSIICTVAEDITGVIKLKNQLKEKIKKVNEISWKNAHLLRGPVATLIGLVSLIDEKDITSEHNKKVFSYVKQTVEKLDLAVLEINGDIN
jgi:PAS domain S-box-containing protein